MLLNKILNKIAESIENKIIFNTRDNNDEAIKFQCGQILAQNNKCSPKYDRLYDYGFKVFSQFDDDGIIQFLINNIDISKEIFIEFGVEDYTEANTRFLLMYNNWKGFIIDGSKENINSIKQSEIYWKHNLTAIFSFLNKDNINKIFQKNGFVGKIGVLSIDIDGNDYWVYEAINVLEPDIVIFEYNSLFGSELKVSIPYNENFYRTNAHYSNLYWGASLHAFVFLTNSKGYGFVGTNRFGNNAYFVKKTKLNKLVKEVTIEEGYIESKYRESRDKAGNLTYLSGEKKLLEIKEMFLVNLENMKQEKIEKLYNLK